MQFFVGSKLPLAFLLLLLLSFAFSNAKNQKAVHSAGGTCKRGRIHCNGKCHKKCTKNSQCFHKLRCKPCRGTKGRHACQ
ncbi:hypothetical protein niasHT_020959 [Heterodera trifolii]|uniref:Uncharacterized protein n=1 Tax=Heterodera trifolii TaxID=157864 RepID=A0ABD2KCK6_9BILA